MISSVSSPAPSAAAAAIAARAAASAALCVPSALDSGASRKLRSGTFAQCLHKCFQRLKSASDMSEAYGGMTQVVSGTNNL
jgi:hypothetical protein